MAENFEISKNEKTLAKSGDFSAHLERYEEEKEKAEKLGNIIAKKVKLLEGEKDPKAIAGIEAEIAGLDKDKQKAMRNIKAALHNYRLATELLEEFDPKDKNTKGRA